MLNKIMTMTITMTMTTMTMTMTMTIESPIAARNVPRRAARPTPARHAGTRRRPRDRLPVCLHGPDGWTLREGVKIFRAFHLPDAGDESEQNCGRRLSASSTCPSSSPSRGKTLKTTAKATSSTAVTSSLSRATAASACPSTHRMTPYTSALLHRVRMIGTLCVDP